MSRLFHLVDVFGSDRLGGNPLGVVHDAQGLTDAEMLALTRWLNLSETTFLLAPVDQNADYRVRIFTLAGELPFAGHPTLGSCHAWLEAGGSATSTGVIIQECGVGLIPIRRQRRMLSFAAPPLIRDGPVAPVLVPEIAAVLGISEDRIVDVRWVDNGPGWIGVQVEDADVVLSMRPDFAQERSHELEQIGVVGLYPEASAHAYEVRAFFADDQGGMTEDPVTGSLNASLAQWLVSEGKVTPPYVASQGTSLGRSGQIHIDQDEEGTIWVGGETRTVVRGDLL